MKPTSESPRARLRRRLGTPAKPVSGYGVLVFGLRRPTAATVFWPANDNTADRQTPQEVRDARVGFQIEGGQQEAICWDTAMLFNVSQNDFHAFLLARRKTFHMDPR